MADPRRPFFAVLDDTPSPEPKKPGATARVFAWIFDHPWIALSAAASLIALVQTWRLRRDASELRQAIIEIESERLAVLRRMGNGG